MAPTPVKPPTPDGEPGERSRLLELQAEVGVAIAANDTLAGCLQACAEALVRHLGAAFARIWTLSEVEPVLELQASAGLYTHLDGPHSRVPVGEFKIGLIAEERLPHLTNQVVGDPRVGNQEWAKREGMVAFAGYPLLVGAKLVGVVALFARRELTNDTLKATAAIASGIAQTIERARAQERLRVSEEWLSTTLKSIGDGVVATDATGRVTFMNPVAAHLTGWTGDAAKGKPLGTVFNIINEGTREPVESPVTKVLREGTVVGLSNHTLLVRRDGTETPIDDSAAPIRNSRDALVGVVVVFRDASDKRRADAERHDLLERERAARAEAEVERTRLHEFLMQAPALICVLRGPDYVFELANPRFTQLVGGREMTGQPARKAIPELEGQGFFELLDDVMASGTPYVGNEIRAALVRDTSGEPREGFFNFVYQPMRNPKGNVDGIFVHAVEVTEQVLARKALERAVAEASRLNRGLVQAEHVLRSLVDNLPELAWSAQPDGHIDFYNRRWYEYTGTTFEQMQGWGWKAVHDPAMLDSVIERWQRSLDTGEPFEMEFPLRRADGEMQWFLTRVRPLRDGAGNVARWFGVNTNIHERKELLRQLESASLAKDEFLATVSHELRTPLTAILGWSRILEDGADPVRVRKGLRVIERNAKAQAQLIEDLLDVSRIISGKIRMSVKRVDLTAVAKAAVETAQPSAVAKGVRLNIALEPGLGEIVADEDRLQQVIWNLLSNAVKFTPKGGEVFLHLARVDSQVTITVRDSGKGISPTFLPRVFDRFRQDDSSTTKQQAGLGLGLAIVRHLVELHGGSVTAESEGEGKGATFEVRLPIRAVEPSASDSLSERERGTSASTKFATSGRLGGVHVLVVDDQEDARDLVATVLGDAGAKVSVAESVSAAMKILSTDPIAVIVSDIGMPGEDGYAFLERVRSTGGSPRTRGLPALALTAYAREEDRDRALASGFQEHVAKPIEPTRLVDLVAGLVRR